jgi:hypothetical protein
MLFAIPGRKEERREGEEKGGRKGRKGRGDSEIHTRYGGLYHALNVRVGVHPG